MIEIGRFEQAAQLSSAQQHIRMQAAELRDAQLQVLSNLPAASFGHRPPRGKGHLSASAAPPEGQSELLDAMQARQPLSLKQLHGHSHARPKRSNVNTGRPSSAREFDDENLALDDKSYLMNGEDAGTLSTTRELLHFIRSLDEQGGDTSSHATVA